MAAVSITSKKGAAWLKTQGITVSQYNSLGAVNKRILKEEFSNYEFQQGSTTRNNPYPFQGPSSVTAKQLNELNIKNGFGGTKSGPSPTSDTQPLLAVDQAKFNLPPHKWSLPVDPSLLSSSPGYGTAPDALRLARMWFYAGANSGGDVNTPISSASTSSTTAKSSTLDNNWGFQFLWNPTQISNSLSRNMSVTPSSTDTFAGLSGLFTAMETVQFTIVIDRVNDFACAKYIAQANNALGQEQKSVPHGASWTIDYDPSLLYSLANYYYPGGYNSVSSSKPTNPERPEDKLDQLLRLGTMADIEYIFRMVNGWGQVSNGQTQYWTNPLGKKTADIAFLNPTAVAVQFGPTKDSLSYVGWIDSISINHTMFTQDMIPIHSEVQMSFLGFSQVTQTAGTI